ncbi:MAG: fatty acid desaturase [Verrucomicrobiota bacterium]
MLKNRKDFPLILLALLNVVLIVGSAAITPWAMNAPLYLSIPLGSLVAVGILFIYLTNYQCISHYHIHTPYFKGRRANDLFSLVNTWSLGVPQTMYHVHHLFHHKGNNDRRNPVTNTTVDFASSYRFSKDPNMEEEFWSFTLKSVFRSEITPLYKEGIRQRRTFQIHLEFIALFAMWALLIFLSWQNFVFFYLPLWFIGQVLNYAENYLEHHGATHTNRLDDSVSCYSPFYNWIWFNNGYHQEHHYKARVHWSELPKVKSLMLDESQRRVVPHCHLWNLPWIQKNNVSSGRVPSELSSNTPS